MPALRPSQALQNARQALQKGDKPRARQWAAYVLRHNRAEKQAWLLLAQIASPRARAYYQRQAQSRVHIPVWLGVFLFTVFFSFLFWASQPVFANAALPAGVGWQGILVRKDVNPTFLPQPTPLNPNYPTPTPAVYPTLSVPASLHGTPVPQVAPPALSASPKRILVDISEQRLYAYEGETLIYNFIASTGMDNATRIGTFSILDKIPSAYGSTWDIWMPDWMGIYWSGTLENGIHSLPILPGGALLWEGYLGAPISYGCIVLGTVESRLLYDWAEIGIPVIIQY